MKKHSTIIGMDLGGVYSHGAAIMRDDDEIQEEGKVGTAEAALKRKFYDFELERWVDCRGRTAVSPTARG